MKGAFMFHVFFFFFLFAVCIHDDVKRKFKLEEDIKIAEYHHQPYSIPNQN